MAKKKVQQIPYGPVYQKPGPKRCRKCRVEFYPDSANITTCAKCEAKSANVR